MKEKVIEYAVSKPVFTADLIAKELQMPATNMYRYLKELMDSGVLAVSAEHQGPRVWRAPEVLSAIDAFAARAGRRST